LQGEHRHQDREIDNAGGLADEESVQEQDEIDDRAEKDGKQVAVFQDHEPVAPVMFIVRPDRIPADTLIITDSREMHYMMNVKFHHMMSLFLRTDEQ
jgi:hypothetical protein